MADFTFGQQKVNGGAGFDQAVTLSMDFWTVNTYFNILTANDASGNGNSNTQAALDKLVQVISLRGQPVILSNPTLSGGVCTLNFAIEHQYSWNTNQGTAPVYGLGAAGSYPLGSSNQFTSEEAALCAAIAAAGVNIFPTAADLASVTGAANSAGVAQPLFAGAYSGTASYLAGQFVTNSSNYYVCVVGGTAASSLSGTTYGSPITDGSVTWQYAGPTSAGAVNLYTSPSSGLITASVNTTFTAA